MKRCGKTTIRKSACVRNSTRPWRFRMQNTLEKEDWKGNDLVACVQMSTSFVAAQTVYWCLVKSRPAASLIVPVELLYFYLFTELVYLFMCIPPKKILWSWSILCVSCSELREKLMINDILVNRKYWASLNPLDILHGSPNRVFVDDWYLAGNL